VNINLYLENRMLLCVHFKTKYALLHQHATTFRSSLISKIVLFLLELEKAGALST